MVNLFLSEPNWNDEAHKRSNIDMILHIQSLVTHGGAKSEARLWLYDPKRILEWFSEFAYDGGSDHKRGAKALAQYAFANRDICWEELEWRGKHGQSPAVVATKPHYLLDLDVQRTIENFLDNVPEFWSSNEFAESFKDGQILFLDTKFFLDLFIPFMCEEDTDDVWDAIEEFLMEESFSDLTQHLLITLEECDLCRFLELLGNYFESQALNLGRLVTRLAGSGLFFQDMSTQNLLTSCYC